MRIKQVKSAVLRKSHPIHLPAQYDKDEKINGHLRLVEHVQYHPAITPRWDGDICRMRVPFAEVDLLAATGSPRLIHRALGRVAGPIEEEAAGLVGGIRRSRYLYDDFGRIHTAKQDAA